MTQKPSKVAIAKNHFSVYVIDTICFDECVSLYVITERHYLLCMFIDTPEVFFNRHIYCILKEVRVLGSFTITKQC